MGPNDAILVIDPAGNILFRRNETQKYIPASTLKVVTALAVIHHMGLSYRFPTEFYVDERHNLKIKGYGDPLLLSEVWQEIAKELSQKIQCVNHLILDDSYFSGDIRIPGQGLSTNPYDAPAGALCANFNTVAFDHDSRGNLISAEPQTPITPLAREKIKALGLKKGRYTFSHHRGDITIYAGELLSYFISQEIKRTGANISRGPVTPDDRLIYTYESRFSLEDIIKKMMEFSNNFIANQLCIALGSHVHGPPGTLEKGVRVINTYVRNELGLKDVHVVEGSGLSRDNRICAADMQRVLQEFRPYRHLLRREGNVLYKTGTLKGIRTRVGYIETAEDNLYCFVVFLNSKGSNMELLMREIKGMCK